MAFPTSELYLDMQAHQRGSNSPRKEGVGGMQWSPFPPKRLSCKHVLLPSLAT